MPEPLTTVGVTLTSTVNAVKAGHEIHKLITGIKYAPDHINRITGNLHGLYTVLGTLETALQGRLLRAAHLDIVAVKMIENIADFVDKCVVLFQDINKLIRPFINSNDRASKGLWSGFKWQTFKKDNVIVIERALSDYKASLTLACGSLTLYAFTFEKL